LLWAWRVQSKVFIGLKMMLLGLLVWFIARATAPRRRRSAEVPLFLLAIIASASISTSHLGSSRLVTMPVVAGRAAPKPSRCARPTASMSSARVR